jgi:hypothetical protein
MLQVTIAWGRNFFSTAGYDMDLDLNEAFSKYKSRDRNSNF